MPETKTTIETKLEGGIKKIITTNTSTFTEPELLIEIQPEEYDILEWFNDVEGEPEEVAITTSRIKSALPTLSKVKDENINVQKIGAGGLQKFVQDLSKDMNEYTHIVAVKKRVPVLYTPSYKTKVYKTITTEEVTDEKYVDSDEFKKQKYYKTFKDADQDIKKLTILEEERVKKVAEEEIKKTYSGPIVS